MSEKEQQKDSKKKSNRKRKRQELSEQQQQTISKKAILKEVNSDDQSGIQKIIIKKNKKPKEQKDGKKKSKEKAKQQKQDKPKKNLDIQQSKQKQQTKQMKKEKKNKNSQISSVNKIQSSVQKQQKDQDIYPKKKKSKKKKKNGQRQTIIEKKVNVQKSVDKETQSNKHSNEIGKTHKDNEQNKKKGKKTQDKNIEEVKDSEIKIEPDGSKPKKKKSNKKKAQKYDQQSTKLNSAQTEVIQQSEVISSSSKKKKKTIQKQVKEQHTQQEKKNQKKSKQASKSKKDKTQSINVLNRQMARQCITKKSNFYLQKMEAMKRGEPVGRGSKRAKQKLDQQKKEIMNERVKKKQIERKKLKEEKQGQSDDSGEQQKGGKGKKIETTLEQSIRIINLFTEDAGDYRGMQKKLSDIPKKKIRGHLRMLFSRCLDIITKEVIKSGRKIKDWQLLQKREIIRQLHRIRCTNRLLSEVNVQFRDKFHKLMMSYNDPSLTLEQNDYNYLYRKIEAFVRGYCSINYSKKNQSKDPEKQEQNRQHLLEGGNIFNPNRVKRQYVKLQPKLEQPQPSKIDPQKIIFDWTEEEECELGKLYIQNSENYEFILESMRNKFGLKNRWKDFELLGRKIDHLIKMGLTKLQQLTSKPYNRLQRIKEEQRKKQKQSKFSQAPQNKIQISSFDFMTKFIYNNKKIVKTEEALDTGIFKNISLLQRQIFGHVESYKVRHALIKLLSEKFPEEALIEDAIKIIKSFIQYAEIEETKNNIKLLKHNPIIQDENGQKEDQMEMEPSSDEGEQGEIGFNALNPQDGRQMYNEGLYGDIELDEQIGGIGGGQYIGEDLYPFGQADNSNLKEPIITFGQQDYNYLEEQMMNENEAQAYYE